MTSTSRMMGTPQPTIKRLPDLLYAIIIWQIVVGLGSIFAASQVLQIERLFNLGNVIQIFIAFLLGGVAVTSFASAYLIYRVKGAGRLVAMAINFVGLIMAFLYLGHVTGLYLGLDNLSDGLYHNIAWIWGIALGYIVYWVGGRFPDNSSLRSYTTRAGIVIIGLCILIIFLASGLLVNGVVALISGLIRPASLAVIALIAAFGAVTYYLLRQSEFFNETVSERDTWQGWLFLMPNFISFTLFFAGPLLLSLYLSFTDYNPVQQNPAQFIGLQNYAEMLSLSVGTLKSADQPAKEVIADGHAELTRISIGNETVVIGANDTLFWISFFNTFFYCILLLILSIPPAIGLAMVLNSKIAGMKFFRALFFIPSIAAVVGVALIWQWLYDPGVGFINYAITGLVNGINGLLGTQIANPSIQWLTDDRVLMVSVVIMAAWQVIGFNTVILLAGLQGMPREVMEAATVDGANRWTRFLRITLPLLGPTTFFVTITTLISGLQAFAEPFSLIGENNPTTAKLTSVYYLYNMGFASFRMGYASAVAWALFVVIFIVTVIQFRLSRSNQAYSD
ncbi:MAG: ABC transporter permease subunit [Anaerolineaceae bacterium]|nr:ABC transporter permease subunit [Anaerolineaceae bacterium]